MIIACWMPNIIDTRPLCYCRPKIAQTNLWGVRAHVSYRVSLEMNPCNQILIFIHHWILSTRSVTFAPYVKPMPAFLHNYIYLDLVQIAVVSMWFSSQIWARGREGVASRLMGIIKVLALIKIQNLAWKHATITRADAWEHPFCHCSKPCACISNKYTNQEHVLIFYISLIATSRNKIGYLCIKMYIYAILPIYARHVL